MQTLIKTNSVFHSSGTEKTCPGYYVYGTCEHGHHFVKTIHCGREWCLVCGIKNSVSHLRRIARWLPKVFQIKSMGYFVFTIPEKERYRFRDKKALSRLMKEIKHILKDYGFDRGLARWHWFGDKSEKFNPHLNVIVDGGHITSSTLRKIKRSWSKLIGVEMSIVNYEYKATSGEKYHAVAYITRSTFIAYEWDPQLAGILFNFRNTRYWGEWKDKPVWQLKTEKKVDFDSMIKFEKGMCPFCRGKLGWSKTINIKHIHTLDGKLLPIVPGYYLIM